MQLPAPETAGRAPALDDWLDELGVGFEDAADETGMVELSLRIAGAPILVRFAGQALADQLGRAFAHLVRDDDEPPRITICAWDSEDSGGPPPPLPASDPGTARGATVYAADGRRHLACRPRLGQLSAYDGDQGIGWFWCHSGSELPFWERAAPFRQILHWWLPERGIRLVHGAAVGDAEGGLLLVGRGGSGKSTCALSSLVSPLCYAGDDYVAVDVGAEPRVYSLYCSGKLEPSHARLLSHLPTAAFAGDDALEEKSVFYVDEGFQDRLCRDFRLDAVVAPQVHGSTTRHRPLGAPAALAALAPSTLLQLVPGDSAALSAMAGMLRRVPAYGLDVGGPVEQIPAALDRLLEEVRS